MFSSYLRQLENHKTSTDFGLSFLHWQGQCEKLNMHNVSGDRQYK
jgi:hypothetical protein